MLTLKNSIIHFLLILAVAMVIGSISVFKHTMPSAVVKNPSTEPDAFMENVIATVMDKTGKPSIKIESSNMIHYAEKDTTHITKPHVTIFRQSPKPWTIDSDSAQTTQGVTQIVFQNHVVLHHVRDALEPTTTMKTASLTIFLDKQIAETPEAVTLLQPDTIIQAVGMLANLNEGTVKLLSQAKGEYEPNS